MTARIFAYVTHKDGVPDDCAAELLAAAKNLDPSASPVALLTGAGAELDTACDNLRSTYAGDMEDREREPGISKRGTHPAGAGEGNSSGKPRTYRAQSLRNRPGAGAFHPAECGIRLRCGRYRGSRRQQPEACSPGIRRAGKHARRLRHLSVARC